MIRSEKSIDNPNSEKQKPGQSREWSVSGNRVMGNQASLNMLNRKLPLQRVLMPPVIQTAEWMLCEGPKERFYWSELVDGVTWYTQNSEYWFEITDLKKIEKGALEEYQYYAGYEKHRSLEEWNMSSVWPNLSWLLENLDNPEYLKKKLPSFIKTPIGGPIILETNMAVFLNQYPFIIPLLKTITTIPSRQDEAYNMIRAALLLAGNAPVVWSYLEHFLEGERKTIFTENILPALVDLTSAIQIIPLELIEVSKEQIFEILGRGCLVLENLVQNFDNMTIVIRILAHDKSFFRSFNAYANDLFEDNIKPANEEITNFVLTLKNKLESNYKKILAIVDKEGKEDAWNNFIFEDIGTMIYQQFKEPLNPLLKEIYDQLKTIFTEAPFNDYLPEEIR